MILKEVPVKKDTNDTYVYQDVSLYYGVYAIPDVNNKSISLFSVTGGLKANSYATIRDIDTITTQTTKNVLEPHIDKQNASTYINVRESLEQSSTV